jgi:hypothetical protein
LDSASVFPTDIVWTAVTGTYFFGIYLKNPYTVWNKSSHNLEGEGEDEDEGERER